jgi:hypothetical protein
MGTQPGEPGLQRFGILHPGAHAHNVPRHLVLAVLQFIGIVNSMRRIPGGGNSATCDASVSNLTRSAYFIRLASPYSRACADPAYQQFPAIWAQSW